MGTRPTSEYTPYLRSISFRSDLPVDSATDHPRILTVETRIAKMPIKTVFLLIKQNPELYGLLKLSPKSNQEAYREYSSVLPPFPNRQDAPPHKPFSVYGFIKDNATIIRRFIPRFPLSFLPLFSHTDWSQSGMPQWQTRKPRTSRRPKIHEKPKLPGEIITPPPSHSKTPSPKPPPQINYINN